MRKPATLETLEKIGYAVAQKGDSYTVWVKDHKRQAFAQKIERLRVKFDGDEYADHRCRQALAAYLAEMSGPALHRAIDFITSDKEE